MSLTGVNNVHYNAIRKALINGNAAVMVGAGFSQNAQSGEQLATWTDIAKELSACGFNFLQTGALRFFLTSTDASVERRKLDAD